MPAFFIIFRFYAEKPLKFGARFSIISNMKNDEVKAEQNNYYLYVYGCQMNLHEAEKLAGILEEKGYKKTDDPLNAQIIAFVTCCIRENAEQKVYGHIGALKKYKQKNRGVIIAVGGCMTQKPEAAQKLHEKFPFVDIIFGTHNLPDFAKMLEEKQKSKKSIIRIAEIDEPEDGLYKKRASYPNAWINVIYGCDNFCTYCIVPYVKGREHSRPIAEVVEEVKQVVNEGYKEVTLLGQNVNSYGKEYGENQNFASLLNAICTEVKGEYRLRFMSNHPKDLTEELVKTMAAHKNICHSIHLPLQSGSNRVLKLMNRKYTREDYFAKIDMIKKYMPDCAISTDVMVGFPTETEQDFSDTLDVMERVNFASAFMFVYSPREGTPAAKMEGQIAADVSKDRIMRMVAAQNDRTARFSKTYEGKTVEILCEDYDEKKQMFLGRDEYGRMGYFKSDKNEKGNFVKIKVGNTVGISLYGEKVEE